MMKKTIIMLITLLTAALLLIAGCADTADEPAASPTGTPAPTATPAPTPEPEPALAICMNAIDHPIHRQVQLGFIDGCKALGYEDVSIIGAVEGDQEAQLDMALEWAKSVESRPAALLLWNGDHNSDEWCEKLGEMGVYVGIPHFMIFVDDDDKGIEHRGGNVFDDIELPEGIKFEFSIGGERTGAKIAECIAEKVDGKNGKILPVILATGRTTNERMIGLEKRFEQLKKARAYDLSDIEMLDSVMDFGEKEMFVEMLNKDKDIIGVYLQNPNSAGLMAEACRECGINTDEILIVSQDITEENISLYESGEVDMVIACPLYYEGYKCAQNFDRLFKGEYVPKFEFIEAEYLTDETADELLPKYKELFERTKDDEFFESYKVKSFVGE